MAGDKAHTGLFFPFEALIAQIARLVRSGSFPPDTESCGPTVVIPQAAWFATFF